MSSKSLDISLPPVRSSAGRLPTGLLESAEFPFKKAIAEESRRLTYEQIGSQLLGDGLLLAALELYMEVAESGYEIQCLKQFFSNPGNFEKPTGKKGLNCESSRFLVRSSSQVTLDSLDFAPLSEDGDRSGVDDRVAVLEFELRKARETISSLRANLTLQATEPENFSSSESSSSNSQKAVSALPSVTHNEAALRPFDRKAVNYLVHEYLLTNSYRLTSITFADENPEQDLENWDDVGLNIERPPDLINLYRKRTLTQNSASVATAEAEVQTEDDLCCSPRSDTVTEVCDGEGELDAEGDITMQVTPVHNEPVTVACVTSKPLKGELQQGVEDVYQKLNQLFTSAGRSQQQTPSGHQELKHVNPVSQLAGIFRKKL